MSFPEQKDTDFSDPRRRFVWMFRGIGYRGMPFTAPVEIFEDWSEHLSQCGGVHISQVEDAVFDHVEDPEVRKAILDDLPKQSIHYQPPVTGPTHQMNQSGSWIPVTSPIEPPRTDLVGSMSPQELAELVDKLREEGVVE